MSTLVIAAQDIRRIAIGWMEAGSPPRATETDAAPEEYLRAVDAALRGWGRSVADARRVCVVSGPGAFTATRVSVTIANAIAFARGIPVRGIENAARLPLEQLMGSGACEGDDAASGYAMPVHDRPPNITLPKGSVQG